MSTKVYTSTQTLTLGHDPNALEDIRKSLVLYWQRGQLDLLEYAKKYYAHGGYLLDASANFGAFTFVDGLPTVSISNLANADEYIVQIIAERYPEDSVVVDTVFYGPMSIDTWIIYYLSQHYDYDIETATLQDSGSTYYYNDYEYNEAVNTYKLRFTTPYTEEPEDDEFDRFITKTIPGYSVATDYYQVNYTVNEKPFVWVYDYTTNEYPEIGKGSTLVSTFKAYPMPTIKENYFYVDEYETDVKYIPKLNSNNKWHTKYRPTRYTQKRYEQTVDLFKTLGMDLDTLLNSMKEDPSSVHVNNAILFYGISPKSRKPIISQLLFHTFEDLLSVMSQSSLSEYSNKFTKQTTMRVDEYPARVQVTFGPTAPYILDEVITNTEGVHEGLNTYRHDITTATHSYFELPYDENGEPILTKVSEDKEGGIYEHIPIWVSYSWSVLRLKKQINETQTKVIDVYDPKYSQTIDGISPGYWRALRQTNAVKFGYIEYNFPIAWEKTQDDDPNFIFLIPLFSNVVQKLSLMDLVSVVSSTMYLLTTARQEMYVRWYESAEFGAILTIVGQIISLVLFVLSLPAGGSAGIASAAMFQTLLAMLLPILIQVFLPKILKMVEGVDNRFVRRLTRIFVVTAVVVLSLYAGGSAFGAITAEMLLTTVNVLTMTIDAITGIKTGNLTEESKSFQQAYEDRLKNFQNIMASFNDGLSTNDLVKLTTSSDSNPLYEVTVFNSSVLRDLSINGYKEFDLLYKSPIELFYESNSLTGIQDV